jgi:hypothetical protein
MLARPSVLALMRAKSLIFLIAGRCLEIAQQAGRLAESSTWRRWAQFPHKVIHTNCGQAEKAFSISDLQLFVEKSRSFRAQLLARRS